MIGPTRIVRPPPKVSAPAKKAPAAPPQPRGFPERVALYVQALHRDRTASLLECFADAPRARAQACAKELQSISSALRQARLTTEFGTLPDALDRVQRLVLEASPSLRCAIVRHLPPALRARFSHLERPDHQAPPAMDALAARLAREVLRAPAG